MYSKPTRPSLALFHATPICLTKKSEIKTMKQKLGKTSVEKFTRSKKWPVKSFSSHNWRYCIPHFKYKDFRRKLLSLGMLETTQGAYWNMILFTLKHKQIESEMHGTPKN